MRRANSQYLHQQAAEVRSNSTARLQRAMDLAEEKGASAWLTTLPLVECGFQLSKSDFRDAVYLRYGWHPARLPSTCVCGKEFTIDHSLSCSHGGYLGLRHNEVRDLLGELLDDTCHNVLLEPPLTNLSGEQLPPFANVSQDARVDIKATGFWSTDKQRAAYFDVRVFYAHARSYVNLPIAKVYRNQEREKRRAYEQRIREVERGTFTPLVFSTTGGAGPAATAFLKRLASHLAEKKQSDYATAMRWLRCRLSFALLRASILCLRGSRTRKVTSVCHQPEIAVAEGRFE